MNWFEKSIALIDPERAVKRAQARHVLGMYGGSSYSGARHDRTMGNWGAPTTDANEALRFDIETLRERARDLVRNTPYASKGVDSLVAHMIGTGIIPRVKGDNTRKLKDAWNYFSDQCDFTGDTDFYGLQALAARSVVESGEALVVFRPAKSTQNLKVPLQIQLLEPDHIDGLKYARELPGGGRIIQGVEFDRTGRKVAYWLFDQHPGEGRRGKSRRISAENILHLFEKKRIGQVRAASWLAPVMTKLKHFDDYNEAELFAKKIQACYAVIVQKENPELKLPADAQKKKDRDGLPIGPVKRGMQVYTTHGEDIKFASAPITPGYADYTNVNLHAVAAGIGMPYELMTGDLSQVNYSSYRAGYNDFRQRLDQLRYHLWVPGFCAKVFSQFYRVGSAVSVFDEVEYNLNWTPPKYLSVNPLQDFKATVTAVRAGLMSLQEAVGEQGYDYDTVLKEIAEMNARLDNEKIVLDTDPRRSTASGMMQQQQQQENSNAVN